MMRTSGLTENDLVFFYFMGKKGVKDANSKWSVPLPFKNQRKRLPNKQMQTLNRAIILQNSMVENP